VTVTNEIQNNVTALAHCRISLVGVSFLNSNFHCTVTYYKSRERWDHRFKLRARRMRANYTGPYVFYPVFIDDLQDNYYEIKRGSVILITSGYLESGMFSTNVCITAQMAVVGVISFCCHLYASSNYSRRAMRCHL
jgi:hypothetical protein